MALASPASRVWFLQVEALFQMRRITGPASQYLYVMLALPDEVVDDLVEIFSTFPAADQYQRLKTAIISRRTPSEHSRRKRLLTPEE